MRVVVVYFELGFRLRPFPHHKRNHADKRARKKYAPQYGRDGPVSENAKKQSHPDTAPAVQEVLDATGDFWRHARDLTRCPDPRIIPA